MAAYYLCYLVCSSTTTYENGSAKATCLFGEGWATPTVLLRGQHVLSRQISSASDCRRATISCFPCHPVPSVGKGFHAEAEATRDLLLIGGNLFVYNGSESFVSGLNPQAEVASVVGFRKQPRSASD